MQNIKDYLSYAPDTGVFTWIKTSGRCKAGSIAGTTTTKGYIRIMYNQKLYPAHRLAWYFTYGVMPDCDIDHKNEIKGDNRLKNLRLDINRENEQNNSKPQCNNTSGFRGVCWDKEDKRWRASIKVKGKQIYLGNFNTPEEAHEEYIKAKQIYHPFWRMK